MKWFHWFLYGAMLPTDIVGVPFVAIVGAILGRVTTRNGSVIGIIPRDSKTGRAFRNTGAITCGHAKLVFDDEDFEITLDKHEETHVIQLEKAGVAGLLLAGITAYQAPWASLLLWALTPILSYVAGYIVAVCRGGSAYRDNPDEIAAYDRAGQS